MGNKSGRRDSNPLPTAWEAVALPGELLPLTIGDLLIADLVNLQRQSKIKKI